MLNPFIVIESIDAAGGSTQVSRLVKKLVKEKFSVHKYHFPQEDAPIGRLIYDKFLLNRNKQPFSRREQALLYITDFFSKSDELRDIINSKKGKQVIVSDRFYGSTLAYQSIGLTGTARKKIIDWITWLCEEGKPALPKPDLVIFLDTPVDVSIKHIDDTKKDYFENKEKQIAIRNSYLKIAKEIKWCVISSVNSEGRQRSISDIHQEIWQATAKVIR